MDIKGIEWRITDRSIERLGVEITVIKTDGTRETKQVRYDGNAGQTPVWGLSEGIERINQILGYEEKFWERPDFNDYENVKKKKKR